MDMLFFFDALQNDASVMSWSMQLNFGGESGSERLTRIIHWFAGLIEMKSSLLEMLIRF